MLQIFQKDYNNERVQFIEAETTSRIISVVCASQETTLIKYILKYINIYGI
jgi:hypothetical protein